MANEGESESEEEELEKLEAEVAEMAQRVSHYRLTLPPQLMAPLASTLAAHRPPNLADVDESGPSPNPNGAKGVPFAEEDQETAEKAEALKKMISENMSAFPALLKRMQDVISRLDKQDLTNLVVPPVYKKKRM